MILSLSILSIYTWHGKIEMLNCFTCDDESGGSDWTYNLRKQFTLIHSFVIPRNSNRVSTELLIVWTENYLNVETAKSVLSTQPNRKNCLAFDFRFWQQAIDGKMTRGKKQANSTNWMVNRTKIRKILHRTHVLQTYRWEMTNLSHMCCTSCQTNAERERERDMIFPKKTQHFYCCCCCWIEVFVICVRLFGYIFRFISFHWHWNNRIDGINHKRMWND